MEFMSDDPEAPTVLVEHSSVPNVRILTVFVIDVHITE